MLPMIQVGEADQHGVLPADDIDAFLSGNTGADEEMLLRLLADVAQRECIPVALAQGFTDFQLTRGLLGVST
jgi:hypothetical protein